jgi:hypothetical protein
LGWGQGFELRTSSLQTAALPFEPHLQPLLLWLFLETGPQTICLSWSQITIFQISASQVASITDMSHQYSVETYLFICHNIYTIDSGHQWLRAVILAPQGTEIRRVAVSSQAPANSSKRAGRVAQVLRGPAQQVLGPEFKP